jgi:hypothetical protein
VVVRKLSQVLVDIKDDGNRDNQNDGIEIGTNELVDDIPVHSLNEAEWVDFL